MLKAGCGISGLDDLEPIRLCYLNEILALTPKAARLNNSVHLVPKRAAPLLLAVGGLEGPEYHRQTHALADVWWSRRLRREVFDVRAGAASLFDRLAARGPDERAQPAPREADGADETSDSRRACYGRMLSIGAEATEHASQNPRGRGHDSSQHPRAEIAHQ